MKNIGITKCMHRTADDFTTDFGIKARRIIDVVLRPILRLATKRKIVVECYPKLEKGKPYIWLHTGDLGFVDEDGFITLNGRARRVIVRQGFKISAYTIEDKITEHTMVKECVAVEVKDEFEEHVPMVYIILKDDATDKEAALQSIYDKCSSELKEYEIPKYFRIVDELPYTQNGKYNFRLLEKQGNEFVESQK